MKIYKVFLESKEVFVQEDVLMDKMSNVLGILPFDGKISEVVTILRAWFHAGLIDCSESRRFTIFWVVCRNDIQDIMNGIY